MNDLELARLHLESIFALDANGRIAGSREPEPGTPPRFQLVRTVEGNLPLVAARVPAGTAARLLELAAGEPPLDDPEAPPQHRDAYISTLGGHPSLVRERAGPAFVLPAPAAVPEGVVSISRENAALLERHFDWAPRHLDAYQPICAGAEEGAAVALCFCARIPSPGIEAGVFTVEAYRGRGYATRTVQAWAAAVAAEGRVPLYSTTWDNEASRRIAAGLGGRLYATDYSLT